MTVTESSPDGCAPTGARAAHEGTPRRQPAREPAARTYARALPIVPVRARGLTIEGPDGRRYLDCLSGAGTLALGHNHPVVLEAVRRVLDSGAPLHALDLPTPVQDAFVAELCRTLPAGLAGQARVRFCGPTATDAVETAFAVVRAATGRTGIVALAGASPGTTAEVLAASGPAAGAGVAQPLFPRDHRAPWGAGGAEGTQLAARWTESVLGGPVAGEPLPAGVILEPVRCEGGVPAPPDDWLRRVRRVTADRSVPLIADETETGLGRTGAFWAVEHSGIAPDVMVLSKAVGGSLPLAVIVHRDDLDVWRPGDRAGVFRGNQLAMAAGTATLVHVRENRLADRAARLGSRMLSRLRALAGQLPCLGDVRGRGLMIGLHLVDPQGEPERSPGSGDGGDAAPAAARAQPRPTATQLAAAVQRECLRRGLLVDLGGRHAGVVRLLPPLTISDDQAEAVLDRLADAVEAVARAPLVHAGRERPSRRPGRRPGAG
ncbi:aminotransferase class III-fold pyridoxal phosphate-dependent enzyme [Streptomyces sp. NPDC003697]